MFEKITLCVYGLPYIGTEGHLLLETAKNDVPLEKLQHISDDFYYFDTAGEKINLTNDDIEILNTHTIESLISPYIKFEVMGGLKRAYYINPPNVNMVEKTKTGYIYYENDLIYYSQSLNNFYLTVNEKLDKSHKNLTTKNGLGTLQGGPGEIDEITFQTYFKKISEIIKILIFKNYAYLEQDCLFREENNEIFYKIPEGLLDIVISSLEGKVFGYSEVKLGLNLLKIISNSSFLVGKFIERGGMEMLYGLILIKEKSDKDSLTYSNQQFLGIKVIVLDIVFRLITHAKAFNKFMENIDKSKFQQQYFMIKEYVKDMGEINEGSAATIVKDGSNHMEKDANVSTFTASSTSSKKKSKASDREKERDRDRERDRERDKKKSKKDKKSRRERKPSKSNSRSKSRERSRTYSKDSRGSSEHSNVHKKAKEKKQAKNVLLKNGYQIILTLLIGRRNNIIANQVKKIINKISFLLHLKEIGNLANKVQKVKFLNKYAY